MTSVLVEEELSRDQRTLLATFTGYVRMPSSKKRAEQVSGVTLADALEWGRSRSGIILVRYGRRGTWWSAGPTPHWSAPPWPPPDLPILQPRSVPPQNWGATNFVFDAGLQWAVTLWLEPDDLMTQDSRARDQWRVDVATAAGACGARWDSDEIDAFLRDVPSREVGTAFFTWHSPAFRVYFVIEASAPQEALAIAEAACEVPAGFKGRRTAHPADLDEQ